MSLFKKIGIAAAAAAIALSMGGSAFAGSLDAFAGKWRFNTEFSRMGRQGPTGQNIVRDPTFTWSFTPEGEGLRFDVYAKYPQAEPTRTMTVIPDEKLRPCAGPKPCLTSGGDPTKQTYAYFKMDDHMIARLFYQDGKMYEYSYYAVSADGKRLVITSWSPETPHYTNFQVFDKQP